MKIVVTRPRQWKSIKSKHEIIHVELGKYLRSGGAVGDSVGVVATDKALQKLINTFEEHKPDAFLFWAMYAQENTQLQLDKIKVTLAKLKAISPKTKFFYGNGNQQGFPDFNVGNFKKYIDAILVNTRDPWEYQMYKDFGIKEVYTLHTFGFDPILHDVSNIYPRYDCFFGGSQSHNPKRSDKYPKSKMRLDFLSKVNQEFKLCLHGKGKWPFESKPYLDGMDYVKGFGKAKIALGMYHWDRIRYYTKRTIYSGASGRMLLTHYIPEMEKDFENHKHLVWFYSIEEGIDLIRYYLEHNEERERIAKKGRLHFIKNHSWQARLREFEEILK